MILRESSKYRLQELAGILSENSLYGKNVVNALTKRLNDDSESTLNKIAIFGLFRKQPPFNKVKDIMQLKKEQLDSLYKTWFDNTMLKLIKTKEFLDEKNKAIDYLNAYVNNIRSLKDEAKPFSFSNLEKTFIDVVLNNNWTKTTQTQGGENSIYNPNNEDVLYKDENIVIVKGDTKAKCVMYGAGKSWCITKADLNYYTTYRINYGATIFFCMQPKIEGPEHTFVIMNYGDGDYAIADETNSGDRAGGHESAMSWDEIEDEIPNLRGLEKFFEYVPVNEEEKKYSKLVSMPYRGDNLEEYIQTNTKDLIVNGSYIFPKDFIRDYVAHDNKITASQLSSLGEDTRSSLIESGYEFDDEMFTLLTEKEKNRYINIRVANKLTLSDQEYADAPNELKLKYIEMMIAKGLPLFDQQYAYAPNELKLKYIEMRIAKGGILLDQQYADAPNELKLKYIEMMIDKGYDLSDQQYAYAPNELKLKYIEAKIAKGQALSDEQYASTPNELKLKYIEMRIAKGRGLSNQQYAATPNELKLKYIEMRIAKGRGLSNQEYAATPNELKLKYNEMTIAKGWGLSNQQYAATPNELKLKYIEMMIDKGYDLSDQQYAYAPNELKLKYIEMRIAKGRGLSNQQYAATPNELKLKYIEMRIAKGFGRYLTDQQKKDYEELKQNNNSLQEQILRKEIRKYIKLFI